MEIQLIPQKEIDKVKWNSCVHYATNGNIFGYKWYLDTVAKEWDGLVEGDYESVMPLFPTEKPDVLKQPALLREAGIYSIHMMSAKRAAAFLEAIPSQYENIQIQLNEAVPIPTNLDFDQKEKTNYQLILLEPYPSLSSHYSTDLRSWLKSPAYKKLMPASNVKPEKIAQLFKDTQPNNSENNYAFHAYQRIMYNALHRGWGATFGVTDPDKNLLSVGFYIYSQGRVMQLLTATNSTGKELGAYNYLMDNILRSHAGRPLVLDFNTAQNYPEHFGAQANQFTRLQKGTIEKEEPVKTKKKFWKFW